MVYTVILPSNHLHSPLTPHMLHSQHTLSPKLNCDHSAISAIALLWHHLTHWRDEAQLRPPKPSVSSTQWWDFSVFSSHSTSPPCSTVACLRSTTAIIQATLLHELRSTSKLPIYPYNPILISANPHPPDLAAAILRCYWFLSFPIWLPPSSIGTDLSLSRSISLSLNLSLFLPPLTEYIMYILWINNFILIFGCVKCIFWNFLLWNLFGNWENVKHL